MAESPEGSFATAIAYCIAYDRLGAEALRDSLIQFRQGIDSESEASRQLKRLHELARKVIGVPSESCTPATHLKNLETIQDCALEEDDPKVALVMGGATKIKQYVFESSKLPEIRGASALLDRINLVALPALFCDEPMQILDAQFIPRIEHVRQQFASRYGVEPLNCKECRIYANGGELFAFAPISIAHKLADAIEWLYTSETLIANSVAVWKPFSLVEIAGGLNPIAYWRRLQDETKKDLLADLLGPHVRHEPEKSKSFGELAADLALEKFRRREGNPSHTVAGKSIRPTKSAPTWETNPYGERCQSCERRGTWRTYLLGGEQQPVCEPCYLKLEAGHELKHAWLTFLETELQSDAALEKAYFRVVEHGEKVDLRPRLEPRRWDAQRLPVQPQDLSEIGPAARPRGYIGVVYADGNNMGALLETLNTPAIYQHFASAVFETTQQEVFAALGKHLRPIRVKRQEYRNAEPVEYWIHPFEILSIGGDDLFLIVPAHLALPIAVEISQNVEQKLAEDALFSEQRPYHTQAHRFSQDETNALPTAPQSLVGLSAGVLLADAKTPIFFLQELVEQLLKSAKKRAKWLKKEHTYLGGTIDFMALKSVTMITSALDTFRKSALRVGDDRLTARPYTLLEMQHLIDTVKSLRACQKRVLASIRRTIIWIIAT